MRFVRVQTSTKAVTQGTREAAKAKGDVIADVICAPRYDRWKDNASGEWTGKVFVAIDPGAGMLRSGGSRDQLFWLAFSRSQ